MKNYIFLLLFLGSSSVGFISCSNQNADLSSENQVKDELNKMTRIFATNFANSVEEIKTDLVNLKPINYSRNSDFNNQIDFDDDLTFEEFLQMIPDSNNLNNGSIGLLRKAFDYANEDATLEEIIAEFGEDHLIAVATIMNDWEDQNLLEFEAVDKLLFLSPEQQEYLSRCNIFCKVWNGIKAAAAWVWENRKEIRETAQAIVLSAAAYQIISGWF